MAQLPVFEARAALLHQVSRAPTLVLVGATGSGKSTQIPQYLFHAGYPTIGVTQPRRVAATSVARRVATEMGVALGEEVGYCVRFDNCSSRDTRIRYLTDGMLLREALSDTSLRRYAVVIVDEAHERSLQTDILLGVLKAAQQLRALATQPLRLVVMSATLDVGLFCEFFGGAAACRLVGRAHPVQLLYTPEPEVDYLEAAVAAIVQIHLDEADGDVLVFLAGQEDIEAVETALRKRQRLFPPSARPLLVCPLFAALPASKQELALRRAQGGARKAILATNIAETSLTIGGIVFVVDAGLAKQRGTHASDGGQLLASLLAQPISRASARQRAGRAGRERPGKCFRLYSEATFAGLAPTAVPEVARSSLAASVLLLYALGVRDVFSFDFITPPPAIALEAAHVQLLQLGALDGQCEITAQGRRMASLPLEPQHAKALLASRALGCYAPVLTLLALLTIEDALFLFATGESREAAAASRHDFESSQGDTLTMVNVFTAYADIAHRNPHGIRAWCDERFVSARALERTEVVRGQLRDAGAKLRCGTAEEAVARPLDADSSRGLRRALTVAFFAQTAGLQPSGEYVTLSSRRRETAAIHPASVLYRRRAKCVIFNELLFTTRFYMRVVTEIDAAWLPELAPQAFSNKALR